MTPNLPRVVTSKQEIRGEVIRLHGMGRTVGLVPTMGALHAGHLSLVEASRRECDETIVTIFVNPTQFGPGEDFLAYPRQLDRDVDMLASYAPRLVFAPSTEEMYVRDHTTTVDVGEMGRRLEGVFRPTHFQGVATVVLKLFQVIPADRAYFGRKDYQQCLVIQKMARDLDVPIEIRVCPTVREPDGLAMSSRNAYLSPEERRRAVVLSRCLFRGEQLACQGERNAAVLRDAMERVLREVPDLRIDYLELAGARDLRPVEEVGPSTIALLAARVGSTRLIDNHPLLPREFDPAAESGLSYLLQ